ncbi:hypothetical protein [Micromonospora sp. WMMD736]|uniref:hypothetical protein n=1 Tax=Micromonospora sp. WMMD736 TaxID=3404112 RepID=UPI003B939720
MLADNNNFWTAWILPLAAILFAVEFTEFYPDYATAKFAPDDAEGPSPAPSVARLFDGLPPFILVTGIAGWVSDALPDAFAVTLIIVGVVVSALLRKLFPAPAVSKP